MSPSQGLTTTLATMALATGALALSSCNIYSFMDSPSGDPQKVSAARAALDRGDFEEAAKQYQDLSADNADIKYSEDAFTTLTKYSIGMGAFAGAFGSGKADAGKAITLLANGIGSGRGETARVAIFQALQNAPKISNQTLRGLTRFLTAIAFIAENLAEGAADPTRFATSDLAVTPTTCKASDDTSCALTNATACGKPSTSVLLTGPSTTLDLTASTTTVDMIKSTTYAPTLSIIKSAMDQISTAQTELGASGSLSSSVGGFTGAFAALLFSGDAPCFRSKLLQNNIGNY